MDKIEIIAEATLTSGRAVKVGDQVELIPLAPRLTRTDHENHLTRLHYEHLCSWLGAGPYTIIRTEHWPNDWTMLTLETSGNGTCVGEPTAKMNDFC